MRTAISVLLLLPAVALADSAFDGNWKTRMDSLNVSGRPDALEVANGVYTCSTCAPEIRVQADGVDHPVSGHPYYDTVAVTVLSPTSLRIVDKKTGQEVYNITYTVSGDGATLNARVTDRTGPRVATEAFTARRVAGGAAGSHACSGSWLADRISDANDVLLIITYRMTPEYFSMHWNGHSYLAKFDGQEYPVEGDPAHTTVSVRRIDDNTVEETDHRDGRVTDEIRMAAARDGHTIEITDKDPQRGQTTTVTLDKQ